MTRREDEDVDVVDAALEARLSWGIREAGGAERAPDVAAAVLARLASGEGVGADGANRMETPHARSRWLAAAVVLLGVSAVVGAFFAMRERRADDVQPARQENVDGDVAPQDPDPIIVVTDPAQIATLPADLRAVELRNQDDAAVAALVARCPQLEHLRVIAAAWPDKEPPVSISATALEDIVRLGGLRRLELIGTKGLTDSGLAGLDGLPLLVDLSLVGFPTSDAALQVVARLPSLRALDLAWNDGFGSAGLQSLARIAGLTKLRLHASTGVSSHQLELLADAVALRELDLSDFGSLLPLGLVGPDGELGAVEGLDRVELGVIARHLERSGRERGVRVDAIQPWPRLQRIDLSGSSVLEPSVGKALHERCPRLQSVDLSRCPLIDDSTVADLVKLDYLCSLDLSHCPQVTRASFSRLRGADRLRDIGLDGCAWLTLVDAESLFAAGKRVRCERKGDPAWNSAMSRLDARYAVRFATRDWQVRTQQDLDNLPDDVTHMKLRGLGDAAVAQLVKRPNLLGFEFVRTQGGAPLTDAGLRTLALATGLRHLELTGADDVTPAGILQLRPLRELRTLHLSDAPLDDASLQVLTSFPHLRELSITVAPGLGDGGMQAIAACNTLRSLSLTSCKNVPARSLLLLGELTGLESLSLTRMRGVDDETMEALRTTNSLRTLALDETAAITTNGLLHLPVTLRELTLDSTPGLDGSAGKLLRDRFPELAVVRVRNCDWVDDEALIAMLDLPRLEHLDVSVCKNTTAAVLPALRRAAPRLRRLDARMVGWLNPVVVAELQAINPDLRIDYKVW